MEQNRIVRRESVRLPEGAGRDVLRGRCGDARDAGQRFLVRAREGRLRERSDRARSSRRPSLEPRLRERFGRRKDDAQASRIADRESLPEALRELAELRTRAARDRLPESGAHRHLQGIPGARNPEPRIPADERRQHRVVPQMSRDGGGVRVEIEHAAEPRDDRQKRPGLRDVDARFQRRAGAVVAHLQNAGAAVVRKRPPVGSGARVHLLDARDRALRQKREQRVPVVGRAVGEPHDVPVALRVERARMPAEIRRGPVVSGADLVVETAHGAEPGLHRDASHGQIRVAEQPCREAQPPRLRNRGGGGAQVNREEAVELARAHAQPARQIREAALPQRALLDQAQSAADRARGSIPARRARSRLGPAAAAGSEARGHRLVRGAEIPDVLASAWGEGQIGRQ